VTFVFPRQKADRIKLVFEWHRSTSSIVVAPADLRKTPWSCAALRRRSTRNFHTKTLRIEKLTMPLTVLLRALRSIEHDN